MTFQDKPEILPQSAIELPAKVRLSAKRTWALAILFPFALSLSACASVQLPSPLPPMPQNLDQARSYMADRDSEIANLNYEINVKTRACYDRFFVASCLDDIRQEAAKYRRAHVEAQDKAMDIIRMDNYSKRKIQIPERSPQTPQLN